MNGIGVKSDIMDIYSNTSHVLVTHDTLSGGPLEGSLDGVLDFVQELHTLGDINENIWTVGVWTEGPDLHGIILLPDKIFTDDFWIHQHLRSLLGFTLWTDLIILNLLGEFITEWTTLAEKSVMLVWRLGEAHLGGLGVNSFLVGDDWVSLNDFALGELLNKILQADLDMKLTTTGNNMLTGLLSGANDEWIGLGKFLETIDELWKIIGVFDIDCNSDDGRHGVFHDLDVMGLIVSSDGTLLKKILIDTDETDSVSARNIWDRLDFTTHHDDSSLDTLDVQVVLGSYSVVWTLDSDLLSSRNSSGEDSTESVESTLIG